MGPTAAGKSDIAMQLADKYPIDLISVDSALVYRGMDIGTAKPDAALLTRYPHALVDIREPDEPYSAAEFCADAKAAIMRSHQQGRIPLLVGGTMLYFSSLIRGLHDLPTTTPSIREKIATEAQEKGWAQMHQRLTEIDPDSAARIHPNDPQRLSRALEVYEMTGRSLTQWLNNSEKEKLQGNIFSFAVSPPTREILHRNIEKRFHTMIASGFIEEVKALRARGISRDLPSMRSVGYRQMIEFLEGECDYDHMLERGIIATRQLAKRQMTWLRQWPNLSWLDTQDAGNLLIQRLK